MIEETDLGFEYWLADRLKMRLGQLRRMPSAEFEGWRVYHAVRMQRLEQQQAMARG
jgi:hypothetical protein